LPQRQHVVAAFRMRCGQLKRVAVINRGLDLAPGPWINLAGVQPDADLRPPGGILTDLQRRAAKRAGDIQRNKAVDGRRAALAQVFAYFQIVAPHDAYSRPGRRLVSRPSTWKTAVRSPGNASRSSLAPSR